MRSSCVQGSGGKRNVVLVEIENAVEIGNAVAKDAAMGAVKLHQVTFSRAWQCMICTSLALVLVPGCLVIFRLRAP